MAYVWLHAIWGQMAIRKLYICHNDGGNVVLVDTADLPRIERKAPAVHTDTIAPTWHPTTKRFFDSKSAFRAETKRTGGIETGNDLLTHEFKRRIGTKLSAREQLEKNYHAARNGDLKPSSAETVADFERDHGKINVVR